MNLSHTESEVVVEWYHPGKRLLIAWDVILEVHRSTVVSIEKNPRVLSLLLIRNLPIFVLFLVVVSFSIGQTTVYECVILWCLHQENWFEGQFLIFKWRALRTLGYCWWWHDKIPLELYKSYWIFDDIFCTLLKTQSLFTNHTLPNHIQFSLYMFVKEKSHSRGFFPQLMRRSLAALPHEIEYNFAKKCLSHGK